MTLSPWIRIDFFASFIAPAYIDIENKTVSVQSMREEGGTGVDDDEGAAAKLSKEEQTESRSVVRELDTHHL